MTTEPDMTLERCPGQDPRPESSSAGPLQGLRVLEISQVLAGPVVGLILADLGAEVIKVEQPGSGELARNWYGLEIAGQGAQHVMVNRGKLSVALDLRTVESREVMDRLVPTVDVLVTNVRAGAQERFGIDEPRVRMLRPGIVHATIDGFGPDGPLSGAPALDPIVQAFSGMMAASLQESGEPSYSASAVADVMGGAFATIGILAELFSSRPERGSIGISLLNSTMYTLIPRLASYFSTGRQPRTRGTAHPNLAPCEAYATRQGHLYIAATTPKAWAGLCEVLVRSDLASDPRFVDNQSRLEHRAQLKQEIERTLASAPRAHWQERLEAADITHAPVNTMSELLDHPQVVANRFMDDVKHDRYGTVPAIGAAIRRRGHQQISALPPPLLGEHTVPVLEAVGISRTRMRELRQRHVIQYADSEGNP